MKLNWFSPLPPAATDIAHFTTRVLPALIPRSEVTLWTDQAKIDPQLGQLAAIRTFRHSRMKWADLNRADHCIYNIGNNPLFHGPIWEVARRHAGIVILHDTRLHHFFDGIYRVQRHDLRAYLNVMESYYGDEGRRDAADCFLNEARNINEMAAKYPLTEHALENALGVLVHTEAAFTELSTQSSRLVAYLPLPFAALPIVQRVSRAAGSEVRARDDQTYRLVMFGYIARNRRLEPVLKALREIAERDRFHLDVFGAILDDEKRIKTKIRELDLKRLVTLHGLVPEAKLDEALSRSDLAINLRYPTMGEASGSQLRIWAHGLPSLVTKVGWYATLPAAAVAHVRAGENEISDIQSALRAFLENPARFVEMGACGRRILEEQHSPEAYARGLLEFATQATFHRARAALYGLAEQTGALLTELFGAAGAEAALRNFATEIQALGARDRSLPD